MDRTKMVYIIIASTTMCVVAFWLGDRFYRQSTPYSLSESSLFDSQVFLGKNLNEGFDSRQAGLNRYSGSSYSAVKSYPHSSFKTLPKATTDNMIELCKWTSQRLFQLDQEVRASGEGSNSQYCEEYDLRRRELIKNQCSDALIEDYQKFC